MTKHFKNDLDKFLASGDTTFDDALTNQMFVFADNLTSRNRDWSNDDLTEMAYNCLMIKKIIASFLSVLPTEVMTECNTRDDTLRAFHVLRTIMHNRMKENTDEGDCMIIDTLWKSFKNCTFAHAPSVEGYLTRDIDNQLTLRDFLQFVKRKRIPKTVSSSNVEFTLCDREKPNLYRAYASKGTALSRLWQDSIAKQNGGPQFLEFLGEMKWEECRETLKRVRDPKVHVLGWEESKSNKEWQKTFTGAEEPSRVSVVSQIGRIENISSELKRGTYLNKLLTNQHENLNKLIGDSCSKAALAERQREQDTHDLFRPVPPPNIAISTPGTLSQYQSQLPILAEPDVEPMSTDEENGDEKMMDEALAKVDELIESLVSRFETEWSVWTLIDTEERSSENLFGRELWAAALRAFLEAVSQEGCCFSDASRTVEFLSDLKEYEVFNIVRTVILFVCVNFRVFGDPDILGLHTKEGIVDLTEYFDLGTPMSFHFMWDLCEDSRIFFGCESPQEWFWRIMTRLIGLKSLPLIVKYFNQCANMSPSVDLELNSWRRLEQDSNRRRDQRPYEIPKTTQKLLNYIHDDSLCEMYMSTISTFDCKQRVQGWVIISGDWEVETTKSQKTVGWIMPKRQSSHLIEQSWDCVSFSIPNCARIQGRCLRCSRLNILDQERMLY